MNIYMRIYKYSMRFRVPALDQSDCSICYNYDLSVLSMNGERAIGSCKCCTIYLEPIKIDY